MKKYLLLAGILGILVTTYIPKGKQVVDTNLIINDLLIVKCKESISFIFDTGANETVLYADTIPSSTFHVSNIKAKDVFSWEHSMKRYHLFKEEIGELERYFHTVIILPSKSTIEKVNGIWGTDIIDDFCWWIDFNSHRICNNYTPQKEADFILTYYKINNLYYTDITIGMVKLEKILIDTGYTLSDIALTKKELKQMKTTYIGTDTCYNMSNFAQTLNRYEINESDINDVSFKNIILTDLPSKKLIGLPFLKRFSAIFINTKKKQIECWK
mgnify:CR=1 FL=1